MEILFEGRFYIKFINEKEKKENNIFLESCHDKTWCLDKGLAFVIRCVWGRILFHSYPLNDTKGLAWILNEI